MRFSIRAGHVTSTQRKGGGWCRGRGGRGYRPRRARSIRSSAHPHRTAHQDHPGCPVERAERVTLGARIGENPPPPTTAGVGLHAVCDPHDRRSGAWAQAGTLAMAVGLDMTGTGSATAAGYFSRVPKARALEAVTEAVGAEEAGRIAGSQKGRYGGGRRAVAGGEGVVAPRSPNRRNLAAGTAAGRRWRGWTPAFPPKPVTSQPNRSSIRIETDRSPLGARGLFLARRGGQAGRRDDDHGGSCWTWHAAGFTSAGPDGGRGTKSGLVVSPGNCGLPTDRSGP